MKRTDLIAAISSRSGTSLAETDAVLAAFVSVVTEQLVSGERVALTGFATFETLDRPERTGRNPRTGDALLIPARRGVRIAPGASLKRAVADG